MPSAMVSRTVPGPPPSLETLIGQGPVALFLDFDGTLVELAPGPDAIDPPDRLGQRLAALADRLEGRCALVSGRSIADIEKHIGPLRVAGAGSHGSDMRLGNGKAIGEGAQSLPSEIEKRLRSFAAENALDYEAKPHGGALHYRSNPAAGPDAHAFAESLAQRHGWTAQGGKCVVEIVSPDASKGAAVRAFMQEAPFAGARPFFVGDDLTDEAGFAACEDLGGAGIIVGEREGTCAQYRLEDVKSVHEWLDL